ncbi:MAG: NAD-dependent epimerase/dehydratase family protein [Candidatus Dadabacteria bacterium]|nr:MAG: NAD-dependent epimerase/dehydratase family protein [Candidatus Dadabacteria bacterium]
MPPRFDIAVLGATGFTGRLIVEELRRQGVRVAAAGRRPTELEAVAGDPAAVLRTDVRDPRSLEALAEATRVLVNTVGPFNRFGDAVADAALAAGAHYVDTTAEQSWIRRLHQRLRTFAHDAGVAFVPAQAVDFAPALTAAHLLAQDLGALRSLHVTHWLDQYKTSRGTAISAIAAVSEPAFALRDGQPVLLDDLYEWSARRHIDLPRGYREVPFPSAEPILLPGELNGLRDVDSYLALPGARGHAFAVFQKLLSGDRRPSPQHIAHLERLVAWRATDPAPAERATARWAVVARATGANGRTAALRVSGQDVYLSTARLAANGAIRLASASRVNGGVGSLAAALGTAAAADCCRDSGATIEQLN